MKTGEIFIWETKKARGHDLRSKYHIFICPVDWQEGNTFLFICSDNYFGDFKITQEDWVKMPKPESFISLRSPAFYTDEELAEYTISHVGRLTVACMKKLARHVQDSETLERRYIKRILDALHAACR